MGSFAANPLGEDSQSFRPAAAIAGNETMSRSFSPNDNSDDLLVLAVKQLAGSSTPAFTWTPYLQSYIYDALGNMLSLTSGATTTPYLNPTILDTLPVTYRNFASVTNDSFTYTVPSGGSNKMLIVQLALGGGRTPTVTQNGSSVPMTQISGSITRANHWYGYLANPSTGTFSISWTGGASGVQYSVMTLANAAQSSPIDASNVTDLTSSGSTISTSVTTSAPYDLLLDECAGAITTTQTYGTGQTQVHPPGGTDPIGEDTGSYKLAQPTPGTETMTRNFSPNDNNDDLAVIAVKGIAQSNTASTSVYTYGQIGNADPDAVTQIATGYSTTTYSYDQNGNLKQQGATTYLYDYLNRITSVGFANSTSTYGYDANGSRVFQAGTTSTTTYPNKFYSIISSKSGANTLATSTIFIWNGDTLIGTVDQPLYNGSATSTAQVRYVHPDHLGSTNVVTDSQANLVQTLDYYPYGASRIAVSTSTNEARKYIGQFSDQNVNLTFLNARYYDQSRGQFLTQDPVFWGKQNLSDPQSINVYSYANDNPITRKDPLGKGVFEGSFNFGVWYAGGSLGLDVDTTHWGAQLVLGPSAGPDLGGHIQGSWDPSPNATLDPGGTYLSPRANASLIVGRSLSSQAPIDLAPLSITGQPNMGQFSSPTWNWSFGLDIGASVALLYKTPAVYASGNNPTPPRSSNSFSINQYNAQLTRAVVSYANNQSSNLTNPQFAAALKSINVASAPWLSNQSMSISTPNKLK